ncbi:hypothetical protein KCP78_24725 [Salmonella enterica subsp. enterica]|nr:hypothetical protein KCP78_24725 [Salmonella enterica subsp. enterica]
MENAGLYPQNNAGPHLIVAGLHPLRLRATVTPPLVPARAWRNDRQRHLSPAVDYQLIRLYPANASS